MAEKPWKTSTVIYSVSKGKMIRIDLEIVIDWDKVKVKLARGALRNKSRSSGLLEGAIRGKIVGEE